MPTKSKVGNYRSSPIFSIVGGLLFIGCGLFGLRVANNLFFLLLMVVLSFFGVYVVLYGIFAIDGKKTGRWLVGKTVEDYLSSPFFRLLLVYLLVDSDC